MKPISKPLSADDHYVRKDSEPNHTHKDCKFKHVLLGGSSGVWDCVMEAEFEREEEVMKCFANVRLWHLKDIFHILLPQSCGCFCQLSIAISEKQ